MTQVFAGLAVVMVIVGCLDVVLRRVGTFARRSFAVA